MNIDDLIYSSLFSDNEKTKQASQDTIRDLAKKQGVYLASIYSLYKAIGEGKVHASFTVPAINIRTLTYDTARIIFALMKEQLIGTVIFEIAKSEIGYTAQPPHEYTISIIAAAVKEAYKGPVFIQGDHYQFKASNYRQNKQEEIDKIKKLIKESINAGFYNIDIDASTLVDYSKKTLTEQQEDNYKMTAELTRFIRSMEPQGITIAIGGEIGHIGGKNSTVDEFGAYMDGYLALIGDMKGVTKVSVQTGTSHGGKPLPDGTIADVKLDFEILSSISKVAREKYHIAGPVQHGASTLPQQFFDQFPKTGTIEIHLATGFQNIVYDHLPSSLKNEMYEWIKKECKDEWVSGQTEQQFIYKLRKKALGPFKKKLCELSDREKEPIRNALREQFSLLFEKLQIANTRPLTDQYVS